LEYIGGFNFQEIVLSRNRQLLKKAFERLKQVTIEVWEKTKQTQPVSADFMGQLKKRLPEVHEVHPSLVTPSRTISSLKRPSLPESITRAASIERTLPTPFSVFIHGDFNTDNIIYNEKEDRIVFIDPHRSGQADYIQDVSVFLVSNYRIPILDSEIRESLSDIIRNFYSFTRNFAEKTVTLRLKRASRLVSAGLLSPRHGSSSRRILPKPCICGEYICWKNFWIMKGVPGASSGYQKMFFFTKQEHFYDQKIGVIGITGGWSSEMTANEVEKQTGYRLLIETERLYYDADLNSVFFNKTNLMDLDGIIIKKIGARYSPDHLQRLSLLKFLADRGLPFFRNLTPSAAASTD